MTRFPRAKKAEDKFYQLRCAQQAGLRIPKTIITNEAEQVRAFYKDLDSEMICKLHTSLFFLGMERSNFSFYTTTVSAEDLEGMDQQLAICPMIFQEAIPKAYELRIAYVDGQCFCRSYPYAGA